MTATDIGLQAKAFLKKYKIPFGFGGIFSYEDNSYTLSIPCFGFWDSISNKAYIELHWFEIPHTKEIMASVLVDWTDFVYVDISDSHSEEDYYKLIEVLFLASRKFEESKTLPLFSEEELNNLESLFKSKQLHNIQLGIQLFKSKY